MKFKVLVNGKEYKVNYTNASDCRQTLRVKKDVVYIKSPSTNIDNIKALISKHQTFIDKYLKTPVDGIYLFDKLYNYEILISNLNKAIIKDNKIYLYIKEETDEYIIKALDNLYYEKLKEVFDEIIDEALKAFNINFKIHFIFKKVDSYFGECFSKRGEVILNIKLARYPKEFIKSVLYHEFTHFYVQNHQKAFYNKLLSVMPDYLEKDNLGKSKFYFDIYC